MNADQQAGGVWIVNSEAKAQVILKELYRHDMVGLDLETVGVNPREESPCHTGRAACWSLAFPRAALGTHARTGNPLAQRVFLWAEYLPIFKDWLEDHTRRKVLHNGFTFDRHILLNHGINAQGFDDTLRISKLIHADKNMDHGLKSLMWHLLGYSYGEYKDLFSRPKHKMDEKQWYKTVKGVKVPVEGKWVTVKRPGGEDKLKTYKASGPFGKVYTAQELIPLDTIARDYPQRLPTLYEYASLDAKAVLELYWVLIKKLEGMPWEL